MFIGGVFLEGSITHSKNTIWFWEIDINNILFYMGVLVKTDAMFGLENPQVEKFGNWALL